MATSALLPTYPLDDEIQADLAEPSHLQMIESPAPPIAELSSKRRFAIPPKAVLWAWSGSEYKAYGDGEPSLVKFAPLKSPFKDEPGLDAPVSALKCSSMVRISSGDFATSDFKQGDVLEVQGALTDSSKISFLRVDKLLAGGLAELVPGRMRNAGQRVKSVPLDETDRQSGLLLRVSIITAQAPLRVSPAQFLAQRTPLRWWRDEPTAVVIYLKLASARATACRKQTGAASAKVDFKEALPSPCSSDDEQDSPSTALAPLAFLFPGSEQPQGAAQQFGLICSSADAKMCAYAAQQTDTAEQPEQMTLHGRVSTLERNLNRLSAELQELRQGQKRPLDE